MKRATILRCIHCGQGGIVGAGLAFAIMPGIGSGFVLGLCAVWLAGWAIALTHRNDLDEIERFERFRRQMEELSDE